MQYASNSQDLRPKLAPTDRFVSLIFDRLRNRSIPQPAQLQEIGRQSRYVSAVLNRAIYDTHNASNDRSVIVGSHGKGTAIRWKTDVDLLYLLPASLFDRYDRYSQNGQSALLQYVKTILTKRFARTEMRADGQVVVVNFGRRKFEVVPAFLATDGRFIVPSTENGGRWKFSAPYVESAAVEQADRETFGLAKDLIRILKCWKFVKDVEISSFVIELLVLEFLDRHDPLVLDQSRYHVLLSDLFDWLQWQGSRQLVVSGTAEVIETGSTWVSNSRQASLCSELAATYAMHNLRSKAVLNWREVFGRRFI